MNEKRNAPQILNKRLDRAQFLPRHVRIDLIPGDLHRPVPAFLNQKLPKYSMSMKRRDPRRHAESAIAGDNLPRAMDRLRHIQQ
jgi:hypothetical protein